VRYYDHIEQVKAGAARALKRPHPPPGLPPELVVPVDSIA